MTTATETTGYGITICLAANEWGNETMHEVAREYAAAHPEFDPLLICVREHAGWFLQFDREIVVVGTANDMAKFGPEQQASRERLAAVANWHYLPEIRR